MPVEASHTIVRYLSLFVRRLRWQSQAGGWLAHKGAPQTTKSSYHFSFAHSAHLSVFRLNRAGKPATVIWIHELMFGSLSTGRSKSGGQEANALPCPGVPISSVFSCLRAQDWAIRPLIMALLHYLLDLAAVTNGQRTHQLGQFDASGLSHLATRLQCPLRGEDAQPLSSVPLACA